MVLNKTNIFKIDETMKQKLKTVKTLNPYFKLIDISLHSET